MVESIECDDCGRHRELTRTERRYAFLRQNPAWETESFLAGLTPEQFDAEIDKHVAALDQHMPGWIVEEA